jgi:quercetin dioxygenase-like cupin family protein
MKHNLRYTLPLLLIVAALFAGCENRDKGESQNAETPPVTDTVIRAHTHTHSPTSFDASRGVTVISPDLYKALADTFGIRVLEATYKPGDSSILHAHPDFAMYVLEGSTVELTSVDGNKQNIEFKKGMGVVLPAESHSAKNIGKTTLKLVVVEVNRPRD